VTRPPASSGLGSQVNAALDQGILLLPRHGPLAGLRDMLGDLRVRQARPLRVEVAGRPGPGKSTLIAALGPDLPFDLTQAAGPQLADTDALVLWLPGRTASGDDMDLLRDFQQLGLTSEVASPLNAIAVLDVEGYWNADTPHPAMATRSVVGQLMTDCGGSRLLADVCLAAPRVAVGARLLDAWDLADFRLLATEVDEEQLVELAENNSYFITADDVELPVDEERRAALIGRFTGYGIALACDRLRGAAAVGTPVDVDGLRQWLLDRSGLPSLRERLSCQFGDHGELIKLHALIRRVRRIGAELIAGSAGPLTAGEETAIGTVIGMLRVEAFDAAAWQRFTAVQRIYAGKVRFSAGNHEAEEALQLLGERGESLADRLGMPADAPVAALIARAENLHRRWASRQAHPYTAETRQAWTATLRACDVLVNESRAAAAPAHGD
jgi:hypothetical protein